METKLMSATMIHTPTGITGSYIKSYTPTGLSLKVQIQTSDGRIYFAPASEFKLIIDI